MTIPPILLAELEKISVRRGVEVVALLRTFIRLGLILDRTERKGGRLVLTDEHGESTVLKLGDNTEVPAMDKKWGHLRLIK
ncbi:MAG: hypothetical protein HGB08_03415 [Candidatus Moranbacteria bacterium]|nr:hypothetical protein [Candidatus Moranbacteria bacterium]